MKKLLLVIGLIIILVVGWYLLSPLWRTVELQEASPLDDVNQEQETAVKDGVGEPPLDMGPEAEVVARAFFEPQDHDVNGLALLIETEEGTVLRFEEFDTVNGPDLRVYLSTSLEDEDFVDLGKLKATQGDVNYDVPDGVDTDVYNNVLIWCKPFGVLFSSATLA